MPRLVSLFTTLCLGSLALIACEDDDDDGGGGGLADASGGGGPADASGGGGPSDAAPPSDGAAGQADAALACAPSTTTCEADVLTVCSAAGTVESSTTCALGCAEAEVRCNLLAPSNGLAAELDLAGAGPAVVFDPAATATTIDTDTGEIIHDGAPVIIPFALVAQADLPAIRVFRVKSLIVRNPVRVIGGPAIAIVAEGGIELAAPLVVAGRGVVPGPGAHRACDGATTAPDGPRNAVPGAGGGGFGTAGSAGGDAIRLLPDAPTFVAPGGAPSPAAGSTDLVPLRGGCDGGDVIGPADPPNVLALGGGGGGALQLVSASWIHLRPGGVIDAGGGGGAGGPLGVMSGSAGGSGGGVLLEAPSVQIDDTVAANGGAGACVGVAGEDGQVAYRAGLLAARGGLCDPSPTIEPGDGGDGGTKDKLPTEGGDATATGHNTVTAVGGGGAGAVGRIRINTRSGLVTTGAATLLSPLPVPSRVDVR